MSAYKPHGHVVDVPIAAPWLEVRDTTYRENHHDDSKLHDQENCHCVTCCVAYRAEYQKAAAALAQVRANVTETKALVQQLVDQGKSTNKGSPQSALEDMKHGPGAWLSPVEYELRKMLAFRCSEVGALYGDDGELHDSTMPFPIDYMRDSVDRIREQLERRAMAKLHASAR